MHDDSDRKSGDGLPFPETDFSPALQRTIKERFDRGDLGGVSKDEFFRLLGRTARPERPAEESKETSAARHADDSGETHTR